MGNIFRFHQKIPNFENSFQFWRNFQTQLQLQQLQQPAWYDPAEVGLETLEAEVGREAPREVPADTGREVVAEVGRECEVIPPAEVGREA